ncbi:hypothetical protein GW17_00015772 [Ensete ventricosum]|nr:hypothetical protein GW17_00015772 [Ensete ventricosum]
MVKKSDPSITKCKEGENWTKVTFRPDLAKFNMTRLEEDVVALMKKRVVDLAGTLGKSVKVELNGQRIPIKTFSDYVNLYLQSASKSRTEPLPRWEICVSLSEGQFQQVHMEVVLDDCFAKSGVVNTLLTWADFKQSKELKKTDGAKRQRITGIPKLEDANDAGGRNSDKCTLVLTEGDSAKALAVREEGKEYFKDIDKHKKEFVWADEQDGNAIELAFSKKKIEARKNWLRQFEGRIEKSATKEAGVTYTITGVIEEVDNTTLRITELPVRRWTQDYKEFLESMMTGNDKIKEPFIKKALLDNLELDLLKLDNKVRFILGVVRGEIIVGNRKRADLFLELQKKGFTPMPKKKKGVDAAVAGAVEEEEDQEEESPEVGKGGVKASDYEYLMCMPIGSLTLEKVQELCADKDRLVGEVDELRRTSAKSLWLKELDALEEELDVSVVTDLYEITFLDEDDDILALKDRLAAYNLDSSPEHPDAVVGQGEDKRQADRNSAATRKATSIDLSDDEDNEAGTHMPAIEEDNDEDFGVEVEAPKGGGGGKGRGKKPAKENATTTATRKRRGLAQPVSSQKPITQVLKPAENATTRISPQKKVRKMRASPFNNKSGSVLGRLKGSPSGGSSNGGGPSPIDEVAVARTRPRRANRTRAVYVLSDSEVEEESADSDFQEEEA